MAPAATVTRTRSPGRMRPRRWRSACAVGTIVGRPEPTVQSSVLGSGNFPTVPVTVRYTLTPLGHSLAEAVDELRTWAYAHMDDIGAARTTFDRRPAATGPPTPTTIPA